MFFNLTKVLVLVVMMAMISACGGSDRADVPSDQKEPDAAEISKFAVSSKYQIEALLKDPESATYRNVKVYRHMNSDGGYVFCGEINAKNGMGGMAGYERFVSSPIGAVIESSGPNIFQGEWEKFCPQSRFFEEAGWF